MTLPRRVVGFLGVVQALLATYSVLAVNFYLAVRPAGNPGLVKAFANYGILLCLVPLAWTMLSAYWVGRPDSQQHAASVAFWSWLAITALMLTGDIFLTVHAIDPSAVLKV